MGRIYFITGASSGFGKALAEAVLARGDSVVAAARRVENLEKLAAVSPDRVLALPMDVTDAEARVRAVGQALERFGQIDVLANIAGKGSLGAAEEFAPEQLREQMDLNFFAAAELTRTVLPSMRARRSGHILNLTSVGGLVARGGFSAYAASKFALEGWSEALRDELAPFGIRVTVVEPGAFRTEFAGSAEIRPSFPIDDYRQMIEPIEAYLAASDGQQPGDPIKAANAMIGVVESDSPPLRLMLGKDAYMFWQEKASALCEELEAGRAIGEATALDGVEVKPILSA